MLTLRTAGTVPAVLNVGENVDSIWLVTRLDHGAAPTHAAFTSQHSAREHLASLLDGVDLAGTYDERGEPADPSVSNVTTSIMGNWEIRIAKVAVRD